MKDFNFFSSFIETKKASTTKYISIGLITVFIFLIVVGFSYVNYSKVKALENEIAELRAYLDSEEVIERLKDVEEKKRKLTVMREYFSILEEINRNIDNAYVINSELIEKVSSTFPKELFVNSIVLAQADLQMQGISNNRVAIAEFQHNLKELEVFSKVNVSTINKESEESSNYFFSMTCTFEGVENNEVE